MYLKKINKDLGFWPKWSNEIGFSCTFKATKKGKKSVQNNSYQTMSIRPRRRVITKTQRTNNRAPGLLSLRNREDFRLWCRRMVSGGFCLLEEAGQCWGSGDTQVADRPPKRKDLHRNSALEDFRGTGRLLCAWEETRRRKRRINQKSRENYPQKLHRAGKSSCSHEPEQKTSMFPEHRGEYQMCMSQ